MPRVAILDDEQRMVDVLRMVLARDGYDVEAFVRSEDALAALAERPVDVLVTDLRMPGPDGLEVLRRAGPSCRTCRSSWSRRTRPSRPAIAALVRGAFDYVEKPFDNDELKALVRRAVDRAGSAARTATSARSCAAATRRTGSSPRAPRCARCWTSSAAQRAAAARC
jgi:DNA-binding NtrC family response regulator